MDASPKLPKITIAITIKNAAKLFDATFASILSQDYPNKEIVVVDGESTDGTLKRIKAQLPHIARWVSEPDKGVYDGMNKAFRLASGEYIIYMNAGDLFFSPSSLSDAMSFENIDPDIIAGAYLYANNHDKQIIHPITTAKRVQLWKAGEVRAGLRDLVCHQATLTKVSLLKSLGGYDTSFKLLADQDLLLRAHNAGAIFHRTGSILCIYRSGGLSSDQENSTREFIKLLIGTVPKKALVSALHGEVPVQKRFGVDWKRWALKVPQIHTLYRHRNDLLSRIEQIENSDRGVDPEGQLALEALGYTSTEKLFPKVEADVLDMFDLQSHIWGFTNPKEIRPPKTLPFDVHFTTFASGNELLLNTLARIGKEAEAYKFFKSIALYDTKSLLAKYPDFAPIYRFMLANPKGFGFWVWKVFVIVKTLESIPDGDVLFYTDAGCELSRHGLPLFQAMAQSAHARGHLFFRMHQYREVEWTKQEVFDHFASSRGFYVQNNGQVAATTFFLKKNQANMAFVREWLALCQEGKGRLLNDAQTVPQALMFREHRYDQSLLSCLIQQERFENVVDADLLCSDRTPRHWLEDLYMLEFPVFWSHLKYELNSNTSINYKLSVFKFQAYNFLATSRFRGIESERISFIRNRLELAYRLLAEAPKRPDAKAVPASQGQTRQ